MAERKSSDVQTLACAVAAGDRRALSKVITLVESRRDDHQAQAERLLELLLPKTGRATRIGVSGVPGVGKSTFIEALGVHLLEAGRRVAVIAVDPTSSLTGGSILGDKTRMPRLAADERAFIRPSPSGVGVGGVARRTREVILVAEAAGYDVVLVETVGAGQSEYEVASMVDCFVLLLLAGAGDELQGIKRGILELADVFVINKADGDNLPRARRAAAEAKSALALLRPTPDRTGPPVVLVSSLEERGLDEVWRFVAQQRERLEITGELETKRAQQRHAWLWSLLREGLEARFLSRPDVKRVLADVERAVAEGRIMPAEAARRVLALLAEPA
jgi:GTPase